MSILDPRLWLAALLALAISSGLSFWKGVQHGKQVERAATALAVQEANKLAEKSREQRQDRVDVAARDHAARQVRDRADAAGSSDVLRRLRDSIASQRDAEVASNAANQRADTYRVLFLESAEALRGLAETCDRHAADVKLLQDAWPH